MDEVVVDVMFKFLDVYEKEFGKCLECVDYWGKKIYDIFGVIYIWNVLYDKGFFWDLLVMENSQEVVKELYECYDIFFMMVVMEFRNLFEDKYDWL